MAETRTPTFTLRELADLQLAGERCLREARRARAKEPPLESWSEAYGLIGRALEELKQTWSHVGSDYRDQAVDQMVQVGAMALRFIAEFGPSQAANSASPAAASLEAGVVLLHTVNASPVPTDIEPALLAEVAEAMRAAVAQTEGEFWEFVRRPGKRPGDYAHALAKFNAARDAQRQAIDLVDRRFEDLRKASAGGASAATAPPTASASDDEPACAKAAQ